MTAWIRNPFFTHIVRIAILKDASLHAVDWSDYSAIVKHCRVCFIWLNICM